MVNNDSLKIKSFLLPISWIYGMVVGIRNLLFDRDILPSESYDKIVISIGNITVGGTGKTPHAEYLTSLLKDDFKIAVLSRGYKRKTKGFLFADESSSAKIIGDEPFQIHSKFKDVIVAVDADRRNGIKMILQKYPDTEVILLDDAFQHRFVLPNISVLLIDYNRLITDDCLLPAGNLREPAHERQRADIFIVTKCPQDLHPMEAREISKALNPRPYQDLFFTYYKYGAFQSVFALSETISHEQIKREGYSLLLVTGIARPEPLIAFLASLSRNVKQITLPDHHFFSANDIQTIVSTFSAINSEKKLIVITEKDAARLIDESLYPESLKSFTYSLPLHVNFLFEGQPTFNNKIKSYVSKNQRNSILSKK